MNGTNELPLASSLQRPSLSQLWILGMRLLLLFAAAGACFVAIALAFRGGSAADSFAQFVCPMHPEVRMRGPGLCPICRMALEPMGTDNTNPKYRGRMPGMPDMTAFENVRKHKIIDFVRVHSLVSKLREIRGAAWTESDQEISAVLYQDQIDSLSPQEHGTFSLTASPKAGVAVTRVPGPSVPWDRATSLVRFRIDADNNSSAANRSLHGGQVGWLRVADKARAVLGVPASAVLQAPEGPYVIVLARGGRFEKQPIEIGENFTRQGFAVVLAGLHANDLVVSRATFFVDADRKLGGQNTGKLTP